MAPALTSHSFRLPKLHSSQRSTAVFSSVTRKPAVASPDAKRSRFFFDLDIKIPDPRSLAPVVTSPSVSLLSIRRRKEPNTVFVAGATGQSGARIVFTLLRQGFSVRAGVPDLASAQDLARLAATYRTISPEESRRLNAVEVSLADPDSVAKAIGPATKAVVTVGSAENGPAGEVTVEDAIRIVRAAGITGVGHLAVVYDSRSGSGLGQSANNVLDGITAFFSNIFAPRPLRLADLLANIVETDGVAYTVVKATLTDDYAPESSHALVLDKETISTGSNSKVSKSQVARLVAEVFSNTAVAENKVVEVSTSSSATPKPVSELLSSIPEDGRRKAYAEAQAKAKEAEEEEKEKARVSETAAKKLEKQIKKLAKKEARAKDISSDAVRPRLEDLLTKAAKGLGEDFSWKKLSSQIATAVSPNPTSDESPRAQ
ncbi:hypothetical protein KSP40_PGU002610 [Platanthera guangdongensis]|uniref:NAD(P)-binding domain-containing protein n=1 Tax=Platanthera guangdongensis TaxID=2320717 RepID=A0ABR2LVX8_9ASPA